MNDTTDNQNSKDTPGMVFFRFFANPWIGIAGSLASLIGLGLAVFFYYASVRYPELVYYVNPVRAIIVKQGTASRLAVNFDGRGITQDVTAVQIAIWNQGKEPIRRQAILQPMVIRTENKVPILEATIRKKSREVVRLELNQDRIAAGELELLWNVLESGDGGVVQILYAGNQDVRVHCSGIVEGQSGIQELRFPVIIKSPTEQIGDIRRLAYASFIMVLLGSLMCMRMLSTRRSFGRLEITLLVVIILSIVCSIYLFFYSTIPDPPFGF